MSGKLQCHCYHLTDFGGVASDALPKMSMPDPTNPAAAFKNFSADDITVVVTLAVLLLTYWALCYWGWQKDREEAKKAADGLLQKDPEQYRKRKEDMDADELDSAVNANNAELTKRLMQGSMLHKIMAIRRRLWHNFSTKHKLLGGFFAVNSNFTRPRRFTVLFCMLTGNMFGESLVFVCVYVRACVIVCARRHLPQSRLALLELFWSLQALQCRSSWLTLCRRQ